MATTIPTYALVRGHYAWKAESIVQATSYVEGQAQFDAFMEQEKKAVAAPLEQRIEELERELASLKGTS